MRAPLLLLPLLPLLLLGVSSQNVTMTTPARPGESTQSSMTTGTSKIQGTISTSNPGSPPSISTKSPTTGQGISPTSKPGDTPPPPVISSTAVQETPHTSKPGNSPSTPTTLPATVQGTASTNNPGNSPPVPTTLPYLSQQVSSSTSSRASAATPAATSSVAQQTSPPASLGSSTATIAASPVSPHVNSTPATSGSLGASVTSTPRVEAQGNQSSEQLDRTTASTQVPVSSLPPGFKGYGVSSPTSATKQPHSSTSSPVQILASSTRPGSTNTSVTSLGGSLSPTTSRACPHSPPGNISKASEAATTQTPRPGDPEQTSQGAGSVSTKPASADQSPASTQPSAPAPGNQTASSSPGHQHPNASFQNEVICKDQVQNNQPTIYLKEAKTCVEWTAAGTSISFFESFCSTGQRAFNASRETCTVTLSSREPRSQHWAVRAVVHMPLDPERVLEELKEKDKLEELGIANITYNKMEGEMIINDEFSTPLIITIVTLAGSMLLIAAIYGCCHQRFSQKKDQQRLTEELQTMENGYHDNPTLEVMETSSEMQEKKVNLNGELGDSWIVPLDTLMKEDLEEEEDTHL